MEKDNLDKINANLGRIANALEDNNEIQRQMKKYLYVIAANVMEFVRCHEDTEDFFSIDEDLEIDVKRIERTKQ